MRTLVDPRVTARGRVPPVSRRLIEDRARRWVLRELDRLDEKRRAQKDEH